MLFVCGVGRLESELSKRTKIWFRLDGVFLIEGQEYICKPLQVLVEAIFCYRGKSVVKFLASVPLT